VNYRRAAPAPRPAPAKPVTRTIVCGSYSKDQVTCRTEGRATEVHLTQDYTGNRCRENTSWDPPDAFIWTRQGCRGDFEVTYRDSLPAGSTRRISCGNASGSAMSCNAFGTVATVRLPRDRSGGRCGQSGSWGLGDKSIWVTRGCYGDFELSYTG
jgi:hypothetical protein